MNTSPGQCPLCGRANECSLAGVGGDVRACWCAREVFPAGLLERVPAEARGVVCVCRRCVIEARFAEARGRGLPEVGEGDFYLEDGLLVFTAQYLRRRGYCCGSGCRHCPYDALEREVGVALATKL